MPEPPPVMRMVLPVGFMRVLPLWKLTVVG